MESPTTTFLACGTLYDHEARGEAVAFDLNGSFSSECVRDRWIAPGTLDMQIYFTPDPEGDPDAPSAVDLGKATAFTRYAVPDGAVLDAMRAATAHCEVVVFGAAVLERA